MFTGVFGSYNKFTELINSTSGLTSSIYGVPSSSSFSALGDKNSYTPSNAYSVNAQPSTSHSDLILQKKSTDLYGSMTSGDNGYSTTHLLRPPTKDVLQVIFSYFVIVKFILF